MVQKKLNYFKKEKLKENIENVKQKKIEEENKSH